MSKNLDSFKKLKVWQEGHKLSVWVYQVTEEFPASDKFGLAAQMQRSSLSVTSNIAEGFGRQQPNDKLHFYVMSRGSLTELRNQLHLSLDTDRINQKTFNKLDSQAIKTCKILQGLISSVQKRS